MKKKMARSGFTLEVLENRETPSAVSFSRSGELQINVNEFPNRTVSVSCPNYGSPVLFNGMPAKAADGTTIMPLQVRKIVVNGSDQNDIISLAGVDTRAFRRLDGNVFINGKGGADTIAGSGFDDHIRGGSGNDFIKGNAGNDIIWGESGNDSLFGDSGNDMLIGGSGSDRFNGGPGTDIIYVDDADNPSTDPILLVEIIRRSTPPSPRF